MCPQCGGGRSEGTLRVEVWGTDSHVGSNGKQSLRSYPFSLHLPDVAAKKECSERLFDRATQAAPNGPHSRATTSCSTVSDSCLSDVTAFQADLVLRLCGSLLHL